MNFWNNEQQAQIENLISNSSMQWEQPNSSPVEIYFDTNTRLAWAMFNNA